MPDSLWKFIDAMVAEGVARSSDELIAKVVRYARQEQRESSKELEALLQEGIDSGPPIRADESFWRERREKLIAQYSTKKPSRR